MLLNQKKNIIWILIGIGIILFNEVIVDEILFKSPTIDPAKNTVSVQHDTAFFIKEIGGLSAYILGFFGIISV